MKKQGFLYGSIILVSSVMITKIIGALFKIPLANMLGGTGMGYFSCAYGLFMPIYAVSVTGLPTAVAKLTAENTAFERYANIRKIKRTALLVFSLMGFCASILIILLASPFSKYVSETPAAFPAVVVIAPSILFGCIMSVYRGYYEGLRNMYPTAVSQITEAVVKLCAGLALCYFTMRLAVDNPQKFIGIINILQKTDGIPIEELILPYGAAAAVLGVTLSSFAGMLFLIFRHRIIGDGITKAEIVKDKVTDSGKDIVSALMKIVIPVAVGSLVTNLTSLIDLGTIVRALNTAIENGPEFFVGIDIPLDEMSTFIYGSFTGLAVTVFNLVPSFTNMFGKGILPNLTEAWTIKDQKRIKKSVEAVILVTGMVAIPSGLGICVLAREILQFLYKSRESEILVSYQSLAVLGVGVILLALTIPVFAMLQAIGRADLPVKIMLIGVAVKLAGNLILIPIPEINIVGAGLSTTLCYGVISILSVKHLCHETGVKLSVGRIIFKPLYAGVLCSVSAVLAYSFLIGHLGNRPSLLLSITFGGVIYLISLYLIGGITKSEINSLF